MGLEEGPDLTGIRVLVVEDDDDARRLVEKVLETQGATVKAVSLRPARPWTSWARSAVDVLLSDIEMPGTDGYQLIKELRLRPSEQGGSVPAAALTAYARTEDRLRALRAGFQLHLAKPVQPPSWSPSSSASRRAATDEATRDVPCPRPTRSCASSSSRPRSA